MIATTRPDHTTGDETPQSFWLEHLDRATTFHRWVHEQFSGFVGKRVLEVGCGQGTYTALLAADGVQVTGVDIDPAFVAAARRATADRPLVRVELADATQQAWLEEFDTVVLLDVLEHIERDVEMLRKLAAALQPDGRIILKVPAFPWLHGTLDRVVGHHRRYTKRSLERVLLEAGFGRPELWYFNAAAIPGWWLNGTVLRRPTPPANQIALFERLMPVVRAIDRVARPLGGLSLFAVATKTSTATVTTRPKERSD